MHLTECVAPEPHRLRIDWSERVELAGRRSQGVMESVTKLRTSVEDSACPSQEPAVGAVDLGGGTANPTGASRDRSTRTTKPAVP